MPLEIFSTRAGSSESRSLGLPSGDVLAISSTGELAISLHRHYIFGFQSVGTLARVPLAGGAPREMLENVEDADWSPDGASLAVARQVGNRGRVEFPIGKVLYDAPGWVSGVRVSPDGRVVAFLDHPQQGDNTGTLKIVDTSGKVRVNGPFAISGVAWSPRGDEVWTSAFDGITATSLSGKNRFVWTAPGGSIHDIARDGRVICAMNSSRREIVGHAAGESSDRNLTWLNWSFPIDISGDGSTILFNEQNIQPMGAYLRKLDGSPAVRIGDGVVFGFSPDGRWALSSPDLTTGQFRLLPLGPGEPKELPKSGVNCQSAAWFPDGRRILLSGSEGGHGSQLFVQDLTGGKPRAITPQGVSFIFPAVSPDGKWIAAKGPDRRLSLYPTEPGEPRAMPGSEPEDVALRWTPDGGALFVYRPTAPPLRVEAIDVKTGHRRLWKEIQPPDPSGVDQIGPIQISPDESSYVYSYRRELDELFLATGMH